MDDPAPHHPRHDSAHEGDRKGVIDVKLELGFGVIMAVVRQDVQEGADEIQRLAGNIRNLEDGAYSLGDELSCGLDGLPTILDEDGDFASTRRLQDTSELRDGLF